MPLHILIHDGPPSQWWLSPDIWIVPGKDPNGLPGSPVAGDRAYVWARVTNSGDVAAIGTRVDFYWSNPSAQAVVGLGMTTQIGSAYVDLDAGETQNVLCLVPWIPIVVNGGHECVIAVAHAPGDIFEIPDPLPNGYFIDPPSHDQIAQLNLSVVHAARLSVPLTLAVNAIGRNDKHVIIAVEFGNGLEERALMQLGLQNMRSAQQRYVNVSLSREPYCHEQSGPYRKHTLDVQVKRGTSVPIYILLNARELPEDEYQLIHIMERSAERVLGGVSYIVVNAHEQEEEKP